MLPSSSEHMVQALVFLTGQSQPSVREMCEMTPGKAEKGGKRWGGGKQPALGWSAQEGAVAL